MCILDASCWIPSGVEFLKRGCSASDCQSFGGRLVTGVCAVGEVGGEESEASPWPSSVSKGCC